MYLNQKIQDAVGTDLTTVTRTRGVEICSTGFVERLASVTGFDLSPHISRIPDITAFQLMKSIDFDLVHQGETAVRMAIGYDWHNFRVILKRNGEHIAMAYMPETMTYPAVQAALGALDTALRRILKGIKLDKIDVAYTYDEAALEDRGLEWMRNKLRVAPISDAQNARYTAFKAHRSVTFKPGFVDGVSVSLSVGKRGS